MNTIAFTKVDLPYGWMGNMSAFPLYYNGVIWRTAEALFQAGRFNPTSSLVEEIRLEPSPMGAKLLAKKHIDKMTITPQSDFDLQWMEEVLRLKISQHPELKEKLLATGDALIIEDCTKRQRGSGLFWGSAYIIDGCSANWVGQNQLGNLWMKIRGK